MSVSYDLVFISSLSLSASIGLDWWQRSRKQPISLSVYLLLTPSFLTQAGASDSVQQSVHYGNLCRDITSFVENQPSWDNADSLLTAVTQLVATATSKSLASNDPNALQGVRVVVEMPKLVLLADSLVIDLTSTVNKDVQLSKLVTVNNLILTPIIGVNPPERKARQRVLVNLTLRGTESTTSTVDYPALVKSVSEKMEATNFLTLEKFVLYCAQQVFECEHSQTIDMVTVRAQKPSALSFAHSSGVEITRRREDFSGL